MVIFGHGGMFYLCVKDNSSKYIHIRFRVDKSKLHHQKLKQTCVDWVEKKWNVFPNTNTFPVIDYQGEDTSYTINRTASLVATR